MSKELFLEYGDEEINFLKAKDPALGKVIDELGYVYRAVIPDMFMALINSIIGQQISTKAQETIWERFQTMFDPVTPEHIFSLPPEEIQTCGISMRKAEYIREIAANILDGSLDLDLLHTMDDEAVCARLSQIKGIGVWTAEMLMIFSMQRTNILSWDDLGIQRGLRMLYRHRKLTRDLFAKYKRRYSPYSTIAGLYLWRISAGACEGYSDPAPKKAAPKNNKKTAAKKTSTPKNL